MRAGRLLFDGAPAALTEVGLREIYGDRGAPDAAAALAIA